MKKILEKGEPSTILRFRTFSWKTKLHSYFLTLYPLGRHFEILIVRKLSGPGQHFSWWIIIDWNPFNTCISRKTTKLIKILCLYFFLHDVVTFLLIPNIVWKRYFFVHKNILLSYRSNISIINKAIDILKWEQWFVYCFQNRIWYYVFRDVSKTMKKQLFFLLKLYIDARKPPATSFIWATMSNLDQSKLLSKVY